MGGATKQWMKQRLLPLQLDMGAEEGLCVPAAMMHHINTIFKAGPPDVRNNPTRLKTALGHIRTMEELASIFNMLDHDGQVKRFWTLEDVTRISETPFTPPFNRITGRQTKSNAAPLTFPIAVISGNGDLLRLPPHEKNRKCSRDEMLTLVVHEGHATNLKDPKVGQAIIQDQLEKFKACVRLQYQRQQKEEPSA